MDDVSRTLAVGTKKYREGKGDTLKSGFQDRCLRARAGKETQVCDKAITAGANASADAEAANSEGGSGRGSPTQWYANVTRKRERR